MEVCKILTSSFEFAVAQRSIRFDLNLFVSFSPPPSSSSPLVPRRDNFIITLRGVACDALKIRGAEDVLQRA